MLEKGTLFLIQDNKIYQCLELTNDGYIVYNRKTKTGLSCFKSFDKLIDIMSLEFETSFIKFFKLVEDTLKTDQHESYDDIPYSDFIYSFIVQAVNNTDYLEDENGDENGDEIKLDNQTQWTYQFLMNLNCSDDLVPVKMYIIEQLLQKTYYHILDTKWLANKHKYPDLDSYDYMPVDFLNSSN